MITDDLARRVERALAHDAAAWAAAMRRLDPTSPASAVDRAGGAVVHIGAGLYVNRAIGMGVSEEADAADVDFVVDFFDKRRMHAEIELCPYADDRLRRRASERGFSLAWFRTVFTQAVRNSSTPPEGAAANGAMTYEPVGSMATRAEWAAMHRALATGPPPEALDQVLAARNAVAGSHDFIVRRDRLTAGVCSVTVHDGVATLGGMGVVPRFRGRGVHAECIAFRLGVARELGADLALVTATPGSVSARNVERAGFQPRYTSVCLRRPH